MLYCLDTNIIIDLFRNDLGVKKKIEELEQQQVTLCLTPIILCELWQRAYLAPQQKNPKELLITFVETITTLDFTEESCRLFGEIYAALKKQGKQTQEPDLMIASICIAHNAVLVTKNNKDFANIKDLKFVVW